MAGDGFYSFGGNVSTENEAGNVEVFDGDKIFAVRSCVVIGDYEEEGVFPVVLRLCFFDEFAEGVVGVFDGVVYRGRLNEAASRHLG